MINKFKGFETQYIKNMFRVDKIDKLNELSRRAKYDKAHWEELKLVTFTLNKEIDQDEKHNFNIIFDLIKSKTSRTCSVSIISESICAPTSCFTNSSTNS